MRALSQIKCTSSSKCGQKLVYTIIIHIYAYTYLYYLCKSTPSDPSYEDSHDAEDAIWVNETNHGCGSTSELVGGTQTGNVV